MLIILKIRQMPASGDGFTLVTKKHRLCTGNRQSRHSASRHSFSTDPSASNDEQCNYSIEHVDKVIQAMSTLLQQTELSRLLIQQIKDSLHEKPLTRIVSFGLGHFNSARSNGAFQLALLLELRQSLRPELPVVVFDPQFSAVERQWLEGQRFEVGLNDAGLKAWDRTTLFYLPHCGRPMHNNILFAHWAPTSLRDVMMIGNSLKTMPIPSDAPRELAYVIKARMCCKEWVLPKFSESSTAFNDTVFTTFPNVDLRVPIDEKFWVRGEKPPVYSALRSEIIVEDTK